MGSAPKYNGIFVNLLGTVNFFHLRFSLLRRGLFVLWGGSLCCGEAGEKEKESARGTMGRGKREERPRGSRRFPLPIVPRPLSIFSIIDILIFWWGYPVGASAEERVSVSHTLIWLPKNKNVETFLIVLFIYLFIHSFIDFSIALALTIRTGS